MLTTSLTELPIEIGLTCYTCNRSNWEALTLPTKSNIHISCKSCNSKIVVISIRAKTVVTPNNRSCLVVMTSFNGVWRYAQRKFLGQSYRDMYMCADGEFLIISDYL